MTSISAASSSTYQSPLQKLQQELQAEVADGTISSGDQDALSSALTDIDSSLTPGGSQSGTKTSSGDVKSKIDDLINSQVSGGQLTTDQATELKNVFQQAFASGAGGPGGGGGGPGGPGGAGGPPPGPPPSDSSSTDSTDSSTDASDVLQKFLESLKESTQGSTASSYSATGTTASSSSTASSYSALLIDYTS